MLKQEEGVIEPFKVFIRIRPLSEKENELTEKGNYKKKIKSVLLPEDNLLFVLDPDSMDLNGRKERNFLFDNIFTEKDDNISIFNNVKSMVDNTLKGYNSTALAYGPTGTGKTHTIFGDIYEVASDGVKEKGICIHAVDYLFESIANDVSKNCSVKVSYLEIYNEQVIDLLSDKPAPLMIVEDALKGVVVPDLIEYAVTDCSQLVKMIIVGNGRRTMASTGQNQFSSRSHAILQVIVEQKNRVRDTKEEYMLSKFLIVDLAGSERGGLEKGIRTQEGANINKSLLSLGNCINILSDKSKKGAFVPYRDSKLTRLLKDSLGGNILTAMIACVSPSPLSYDETMNTLKYANRARTIQKKISKNVKEVDVHISQYKDIIDSLKGEIEQLKDVIKNQQIQMHGSTNQAVINLNSSSLTKSGMTIDGDHLARTLKEKEELMELLADKEDLGSKTSKPFFGANNNISKISKRSANAQTVQNVDVEIYKSFLMKNPNEFNCEELEKQVDNLHNDKVMLEEFIEKGSLDQSLREKYNLIKKFYEKYLELINDKLVENIEQNMILKFNMKEILDLNHTNNHHMSILHSQTYNLENMILEKPEDVSNAGIEISKLKEEIQNIQKATQENDKIKTKISISLTKNLKLKKALKAILVKLISNSQNKDNIGFENAYKVIMKEKEELQSKNQKYQNYLNVVLQEKEMKDNKLKEVENELRQLKEKLKRQDTTAKKGVNSDNNEWRNEKLTSNLEIDEASPETIHYEENLTCSEVENIEVNLQDDYFNNNKKRFIGDINKNEKEDDLTSIQNVANNSVQKIKYIINQTNNIINNNINKIISKEKSKASSNHNTSRKSQRRFTAQGQSQPRSIKKIPATSGSVKNVVIGNVDKQRSKSKSPKGGKNQKLREFDRIIESQLNDVYNKKAKELGDRMKKKFKNSVTRPIKLPSEIKREGELNRSLSISRVSINQEVDFNSELDIVEHINADNNVFLKNYNCSSKREGECITPKGQKNTNAFNKLGSNSVCIVPSNNQLTGNTTNLSANSKNINIQKFINASTNVNPSSYINSSEKEKPVQVQKRDRSPGLLKQARMERHYKNQSNSDIPQGDKSSGATGLVRQQSVVSKNSVNFLNEYCNAKKNVIKTDISDNVTDAIRSYNIINAESGFGGEIGREEVIRRDEDINSNINVNIDTDADILKTSEDQSVNELFKSLNSAIRDPKVAKYLK